MSPTAARYYRQAESFRVISREARRRALGFSFLPRSRDLWLDIATAARRCANERIDRARALEAV